jgi:hypothetical protein
MKPKLGWKVTQKDYMSISFLCLFNPVKYLFLKWVKPVFNCGPLGIFKYRRQARAFVKAHYLGLRGCNIFRCEYIPSIQTKIWNISSNPAYPFEEDLKNLPEGTILADKVKLLYKV